MNADSRVTVTDHSLQRQRQPIICKSVSQSLGFVQDEENGMIVDKTVPGAAAVNQKGKWDYLIGVGLACFIGLLNGSLSGKPPKVSEGIRCRQCLPHASACTSLLSSGLPFLFCLFMSLGAFPEQQSLRCMQGCCASAVPFKYAQKEVKGIVYILSFGIGVAIVRLSSPS